MSEVLETRRLILREMTRDDRSALESMLLDPEVMHFWEKTFSREDVENWIDRQLERYSRDGVGYWLASRRDNGDIVGQAGLLTLTFQDRPELMLGYILRRDAWGQGFATEAAAACRDYALNTIERERVLTLVRPENGRSIRVAQRLEMREIGAIDYCGFKHLVFEARTPTLK